MPRGGVGKNSRMGKAPVDVGKVKVKKRWLFVSRKAIDWPNLILPTFGNTRKAERNAGIGSES